MQQQAAIMAASHGGYLAPSVAFPATDPPDGGAQHERPAAHPDDTCVRWVWRTTLKKSHLGVNLISNVPSQIKHLAELLKTSVM